MALRYKDKLLWTRKRALQEKKSVFWECIARAFLGSWDKLFWGIDRQTEISRTNRSELDEKGKR